VSTCLAREHVEGSNEHRDVKPLLASAEAACRNWRRVAEYFAVTNDRPKLANARWQLSVCQAQRDAFASELLFAESV
jgi:hypothetical protein